MADKYIVSYGESPKYVTGDPELISHVTEQLRRLMSAGFPALPADRLPRPSVERVRHSSRYDGYPELTEAEIPAIFGTLSATEEARRGTKELNSDAPWTNI